MCELCLHKIGPELQNDNPNKKIKSEINIFRINLLGSI
jgi:hypothetical protein